MLTQAPFVPYCSSFQIALWRVVKWLGLDREFFWWVSGKRGGGYIQVDQVAYPIFWIVELDREGKFSLRFVGAYRHNSSLGTLFLSLSIYVCVCVHLRSRRPGLQPLSMSCNHSASMIQYTCVQTGFTHATKSSIRRCTSSFRCNFLLPLVAKTNVVWDLMPYTLICKYRRLGDSSCV